VMPVVDWPSAHFMSLGASRAPGALGFNLGDVEVAMAIVCNLPKAVHVCAYTRVRFGKLEYVCEHCRTYPSH
jgi:hypothetical protein